MPRQLSAAAIAAIAGKTVRLASFAQLAFADNTLYLWTGTGPITPSGPPSNPASTFPYGQTFTGAGWLGKVSAIPQTTKIQAQNVTLSLSGIPSSLLSEAINQVRIGGTVTLWYAFFDATTGALILDPVQVFAGSMDIPSLDDQGATSTIAISCENTLLSLNLAPNRRFDDPDQQLRSPGDLGFSFLQALQNIQLFWPSPAAQSTPYPVYWVVSPSSVDVIVGGTVTITVTVHNSDLSTTTNPSQLLLSSSNPKIATISGAHTVTGVAPGECSIMARLLGPASGGNPSSMVRQVCNLFVHA